MRRRGGTRIHCDRSAKDFSEGLGRVMMAEHISRSRSGERSKAPAPVVDAELERIREAVRGILFGEVRVIIQDGLVVQIERLEKQRFR